MKRPLFTGCAAALATPFADGAIDFTAFGRLIDMQLAAGTDALVVCGTTGEPSTLTQGEKDALLVFALKRADGRVPVIAGTGANCTRIAAEQSRRAEQLGADALLAVTPYYNKATQQGLIEHFAAIADAVSLPVILYNVPSRTGVNLLPETAARLIEHENLRGIKEASGDISQFAELARLCGGRAALYAGNDDQALPMLSLGAQGVISASANAVPQQMKGIVSAWLQGDCETARAIQLSLLPLIHLLFSEVNPIPVKAALQLMGVCRAEVRLPLTRLSEEKWSELRAALRSHCLKN